jgi:hypothetical protein
MTNPDLLNGTPTAPGATEFDEWLRGKNDQAAKRAAMVVGAAKLTTTPTEAARRKAVAELSGSVLGTPLSTKLLTEPNVLSMVEGKVESTRALDTLSANPKLASWIADQDNAAIASDRIGELGLLSQVFNGVARGGDKLYEDLLGSGANFRSTAELLGRARDSQRTFDEIMADQKKSQSVGAMDETKRDALVRLQRDMGPGYTGAVPYDPASGEAASISTNVASVKRWLESRIYSVTAFGQGDDAGVGKLEGLAADAAVDVQRQDTERQERFPIGRSAADISRQFSEMPEDASFLESTTAMFSIVRDNPSGFVEYLAGTAAESGVALIASTAVTAATRSPALGRAALFGTAVPVARASNTLEVASSMGYDLSKPEDARRLVADQTSLDKVIASAGTYATVVSLVDAATAGLGSQLIKNPVGSFIMEAVTQAVAGGGGEAFARLASGQKWSWTDVILEGLAEMVTAPLEAGGLASGATFRKYRASQKASDRRSFFQALSKGSTESELRKRSPETYKSAVAALTKDGPVENVYVDAARVEQLFQDAPEQLTALFDRVPDLDYRAFKRAAETGGAFAIPTAVYATDIAGTDIDVRLTDNLRLRADQLSYAEAQEAMAETETQMKDLEKRIEELKGMAELDPVAQEEYESLVTQLVVSGRAPGVARAEAQLLASTVQTMAQRQGVTTTEFVRRNMAPVIRREGAGAVTQSRVMRMNDLVEGLRDPIQSGLPEFEAISAELAERGLSVEAVTEDDLRLAAIAVADKGGLVSSLDEDFLLTPSGIYRATPGETLMQTGTPRVAALVQTTDLTEGELTVAVAKAEKLMSQKPLSPLSAYKNKGLSGKVTAETRQPVLLPIEVLRSLTGTADEARVPGDPKFDNLSALVETYGFTQARDGDEIEVRVNHLGQAFIYEGNTRVAVATARGIKEVRATVKWMNGAERVAGPMSPDALFGPTALYQGAPGVRTAEIATASDFDGELSLDMFRKRGWFIVSATQSRFGAWDSAENVAEAERMRGWLQSAGLAHREVRGRYAGTDDGPSFLVFGDETTYGETARSMFRQESILTRRGFVYSPYEERKPVPLVGLRMGDALNPDEDYQTTLPDGRTFTLDLDWPAPKSDDPRDDLVLREDGKVEMTHWSPRGRTTIDPTKAGKGPLDGPERHRSGPNKAFYGLNVGKRNTAYRRESPALGSMKHTVAVDPSRLYPWDTDPDGLRAKIDGKLPQVQQIGAYERAIRKAGYVGYFVIDGPLGDVAAVFEALPVEKAEIDMALYQSVADVEAAAAARDGEEAYRAARARSSMENPAFREWFGESKVVDEEGLPLTVHHGTRTQFSEFDPALARDGAHWFTASKPNASTFSGSLEPGAFYLRLLNPKVITQDDLKAAVDDGSDDFPRDQVAQFVERAKVDGHDGLVIRDFLDVGEVNDAYLAFEAPAIKSVFNRGTFDPSEIDTLLQGRPDGARGQIILPPNGSDAAPEITLFDRADLSTVIHEGGHWMLWMLQTGAAMGDAFSAESMEAVKTWLVSQAEDIAKEVDLIAPQVLEYLANGTTGAVDVDAAVHRGIHERFARGFEAYMREGKAPSIALRGTFHRFAAWLMEVYKSATKLRVQLSDEVRQVFDKMIATDAQIAQARQLSVSAEQIAATAKAMGLDQASYEELIRLQDEERAEAFGLALRETLTPIMAQRTEEMRSIRTGLQKKVSDEVNDQRHNRAFEWLANGRWAGVAEVPDDLPADLRMDPEQLVEDYGSEILDKLPRGRRPMTRPGGLSADETAGWFGYASGAEMLNDLTTKPRARDEIKQRVQAEMAEMVAAQDPREEAEQASAIVDALHGEKHGQVLAAELRAINRISNRKKTITSRQQAAMMARDIIARMPVRDAIRSDLYDRQARAHGEQASRLLIAGDTEAAFEAKRKQLIQHSLFVESRKAADLVARTERKAAQLKRAGTRKNLAGEYLEAIDDLLYTYDFRKLSAAAEQRRGGLVRYIEMMVKAGRENELAIPDHLVTNASRVPYKTLSVQRLQGVLDALSNIEHTARLKKKLLDRQRERDMDAVVGDIEEAFEKNVRGKDLNRVPTGAERVRDSVREYVNYASNADTLLRRVDGWETGAVYSHVKSGIDRASTEEVKMRLRASEQLDRLFDSYGRGERRGMAPPQVWEGYEQSLSKWDLISIALNSGNKDNWERLTSLDNPRAIPASVAQALLENLDERDWKFVQSVWDHLDAEYWPQISAREKRTTGVVPKKVEAQLMATVKGMPAGISGGYYPIVYDRRFSAKVAEEKHQEIQTAMQAGRFGKAQTKNGHTKERAAGSGGRTIELGMHVLFGHVNQVIHDIALSEEVANAWKILQQPRVRGLFERAGLLADLASLEVWLQDVASGQIVAGGVLGRLARHAKSGFTVSKLAFNMSTVLIQPTGLVQTAAFLGKRALAAGYSSYVAQGIFPAAARVKARSAFMAERERTFQRDMFDLIGEVNNTPLAGALGDARALLMNAGFWAMQKMQFYVVDTPTWIAGYEHGRKRGMSDPEAVEHADRVVARAQASGVYADRTAIERGTLGRDTRQNEFLRLFTALGSYMFAKFNIAQEIAGRTSRDVRDPDKSTIAAVLNGTVDMALIFTVEAVLYHLVKGTLPGDEEEEDERGWLQFLATQTTLSAMGTLPFIRDMGSALQGFDGGGAYGGVLETLAKPLIQIGQGEMDEGLIRSINDLVGIAAPGYPSTAIWRLANAEMARQDDREVSPLHYVMGLPR